MISVLWPLECSHKISSCALIQLGIHWFDVKSILNSKLTSEYSNLAGSSSEKMTFSFCLTRCPFPIYRNLFGLYLQILL